MNAMQTVFKRILHYVILAALLIGTPLVCCLLGGYDEILEGVKNFPPRTEDFGFYPEKLWNNRCPFNWWAFIGLVLFTAMCLKPFVRRCLKAAFAAGLGGSLDGFAGNARRAPRWMIRCNLEWLYRLIREPRRLGRMMRLPKFILRVIARRMKG